MDDITFDVSRSMNLRRGKSYDRYCKVIYLSLTVITGEKDGALA